MLLLARKEGQIIKIGENIEVKVMGIENNQVCIGIKAPKEIKVLREEIEKKIEHI